MNIKAIEKSVDEFQTVYLTAFNQVVSGMLIIDNARREESEPSEALTKFIDSFDISLAELVPVCGKDFVRGALVEAARRNGDSISLHPKILRHLV